VRIDRMSIEAALRRELDPIAGPPNCSAIVLTTELATRNVCSVWDPNVVRSNGQLGEMVEEALAIPKSGDHVQIWNPLASVDSLDALLAYAAQRFPHADRFGLVLKGHGNGERFLRPFVALDVSEDRNADCKFLMLPRNVDNPNKGVNDPAFSKVYGISIDDLFAAINRQPQMHFRFVFPEACGVKLSQDQRAAKPNNVDAIFVRVEDVTPYINIQYGDLRLKRIDEPEFLTLVADELALITMRVPASEPHREAKTIGYLVLGVILVALVVLVRRSLRRTR
jgi:hypothetical protein